MTITCPHCQHHRVVSSKAVPPETVRILCPKCGGRFPWPPPRKQPPTAKAVSPAVSRAPLPTLPATKPLTTAGFGLRLVSQLIDGLVYSMLMLVLGVGLAIIISNFGGNDPHALTMMIILAVFVVIAVNWLYAVFFIGYCGQTPGKMVTRIKVVRTNGDEVGFGAAIFREVVGKFISCMLLFCGYLMVLFDDRHQGLHDKIADTYVIKL